MNTNENRLLYCISAEKQRFVITTLIKRCPFKTHQKISKRAVSMNQH
ncbi:Hypothetical protein PAU_01239 [Photorhabdus asymbiotica]|uniref:Uncharacterized protein n=1 Tax=Photorhabdus asymbiotica subsp. asymbiotica (strain ATCC 43949 / 3105-77) TaxID=553480 RepID=B6VKA3_PHOAA|nr:Hypothetical protein PAU_01239 [Photorhabdus asymbiotica]CAR66583.1 Hypothetical protein PA-RVA2-4245 [Photorhabdus asymbiotica subsp. asymbiotica ATCC 43949]